ncbi:MAG: sugar ABC transporter permease [Paenibacillaceae bacterium]|nr:sugar ABC transporter permease [Paenibacillaceae bacterium]
MIIRKAVAKQNKLRKASFAYNLDLTVMVVPGIVFFLLFSYLPLIGLVLAFKEYNFRDGMLFSPWVGFKNFAFFFTSNNAYRITFNTLALNAIFIVTSLVVQLTLAIVLTELKKKWFVKVSNTIMFLPYFVSWVVVGYFAYALFNMDYGMLNSVLTRIGMQPVEWYSEPRYWPTILALTNIWKTAGYGCVLYYAAIIGINADYYEAAAIDGAGKWKQMTHITLPLIRPLIIILLLLALGKIFYSDFGLFYNLTRNSGLLYSTTDVMDTYVYRTLRVTGDVGMASAAGLFQSAVGFMLVFLSNALVRKFNKDYSLF